MFDWVQKLNGIKHSSEAYFWLIIIVFNYQTQINPITAFNLVQFTYIN